MTSEDQAQDTIRSSGTEFERSAETHRERSDLPGIPSAPRDETSHSGSGRGPNTLFAKVVGIRR